MHVNGLLTPVIVDDYLPARGGNFVFARNSKKGEIWAALLEKAWAKLFGSYARIEKGMP